MNIRTLILLAVGSTCALASHADGDAIGSRSDTREAPVAAADIISNFIAACAAQDGQRLRDITTADLRIEYALDTPGTYYSVDSLALASECPALNGVQIDLDSVRLYPTADQLAMFVQYETAGDIEFFENRQQLALIELRDERIARVLNFAQPSNVTITARIRGERPDRAAMVQDAGK